MADAPAAPAASASSATAAPTATDRWPALESNAEVMSEFLQRLLHAPEAEGTSTPFSFADVFSLDEECLGFVPQPVHALVLAYASDAIEAQAGKSGSGNGEAVGSSLVFIRQLPALDAACGTIALLHAASNSPELRALAPADSLLGQFLAGAGSGGVSTPEAWGQRLDADDALRAAHCACAAAGVTEEVHGDDVVFHFVAFLPTSDPATIVELDGLKPEPVVHTVAKGEGFLQRAVGIIKQEFLDKFSEPEGTQMNVLALTSGAGEDLEKLG